MQRLLIIPSLSKSELHIQPQPQPQTYLLTTTSTCLTSKLPLSSRTSTLPLAPLSPLLAPSLVATPTRYVARTAIVHQHETNVFQNAGENKKAEAEIKHDASHAGANVGGYSVSASGIAQNDPNRSEGSWNQTVGSGKEALGNLVGNESLKKQGVQQNAEGKEQEAKGQLNDLGSGIADRVSGTVGGAVASVTGNQADKAKYEAKHDEGKTQQRGVEADLDKQARA